MATRPPRLKRPHTYFHVTTRGANRWNVFLDDQDRRRFMGLLSVVCQRYGVEVAAYCLMGNHLHLVLYCPDPVLSSAMRDVKSRYAKYFHRRHKSTGPLFEGPFVEVPILDDDHLMFEVRYTHRNPLDLDPAACLATCPWSSHGIYLGLQPEPSFMNTQVVRRLFGASYRLQIERPRPNDKVQNRVGPIVDTPGVSTIGVSDDWSLSSIRREVANAAGHDIAGVKPRAHNGLIGVAALVAMRTFGYTAAEIAEPFGFNSRGAAHAAARRAEERIAQDSELMRTYNIVCRRLGNAA